MTPTQPDSGFLLDAMMVYQVKPGDDRLDSTVSWLGDEAFGTQGFPLRLVSVVPHRNIVTSDPLGTVVIEDDDPPPEVTISPLDASGTEATGLTWSVELDEPQFGLVFVEFWPLPPGRRGGAFGR